MQPALKQQCLVAKQLIFLKWNVGLFPGHKGGRRRTRQDQISLWPKGYWAEWQLVKLRNQEGHRTERRKLVSSAGPEALASELTQ